CKRMSKSSEYSLREREKWLKMWPHLCDFLVHTRTPFVLDITFHVELAELPDDFLVKNIAGKLRLVQPPCILISNDTWHVEVKKVDLDAAREHLKKYYVRDPSEQLNELIGGHRDSNRGFTSVSRARHVRIGEGG